MNRRNAPRTTRRITCDIETPAGRSTGIVRDLSESGLFIQTLANPAPNTLVHLHFDGSGNQVPIRIEAGVARKRRAPSHFQAVAPSGVGFEVIPPRDVYTQHILRPGRGFNAGGGTSTPTARNPLASASALSTSTHSETNPAGTIRTYRIRIVQLRGGREQFINIDADSAAHARTRALDRAGALWKVAEVLTN